MAVTNVAQVRDLAKTKLEDYGFKVENTKEGYLRINLNEQLWNDDISKLMSIRTGYGLSIGIKRSGAGLRILFM